jgi:nucleotide-binding universal stress UspA family protein
MNQRIVVVTDASGRTGGALRTARWLAERTGAGVEVIAAYGYGDLYAYGYQDLPLKDVPPVPSPRIEALRAKAKAEMEEVGGGAADWSVTVRVGRVAPAVARFAGEKKAALIVMGLRQPEPLERWLGRQELLRIVHLSHIPVLAVPHDVSGLPRQVIVAVDFSDFSRRAAREALRWVAPDARVHLVHAAWSPAGFEGEFETTLSAETYRARMEQSLEELAGELEKAGGIHTRVHLVEGDAGREVARLADEIGADLIAMGSHGAGFFGRMVMGSVSSKLIHGAECSLFIAPPEEESEELLKLDEGEVVAELGGAREEP